MTRCAPVVLVVLAYAAAAFYPFHIDLAERNRVQHQGDGSVLFEDPGLLRSGAAPAWVREAMDLHAIEMTLEVKPALIGQAGPARILTLSKDPGERNFTLGQAGTRLIFRLRHPRTNKNGIPAFSVDGVFDSIAWRTLQVRVAKGTLHIAVDGHVRLEESLPPNALGPWDASYALGVGNEITGTRPWLGTVRKAQVRVGGSTYDCLADLQAPFWVRRPVHWEGVPFELHLDLRDILVNVLGLLPLGAILAWRCRMSILRATLWSGLLSLLLETGQFAFAARNPSAQDWALNITGGALGAWWAHRRLSKPA